MKVYLEYLYHHSCDHCKLWWTIADIPPQIGAVRLCPHCTQLNVVEAIQTHEDVNTSDTKTAEQ